MNLNKISELLKNNQPKPFNHTVSANGTYIYSQIEIPVGFEVFINEKNISLKYPIGNLSDDKIKAISELLNNNSIGEFMHRTYGINSTTWSVWDLQIDYIEENKIVETINKIRRLTL